MTKSATDLMQDILFSAVIDSIQALKTASKGLPNTLLRDLNAIHANVTLADLPEEVQAAIATNVRSAFTRLLKEGYSVMPRGGTPERRGPAPAPVVGRGERRPPQGERRPPAGGRPGGPKPTSPGGRPQGPRRPPKPRG
ncbi:hypothetical protein SCH01S_28_00240 [Sphingomonas changbaiensis NBRC 104936]|uniref:Uncharacterized protein n=1 Tax=Sphingomonas changbaiensis NBRC 104936 TaxID=1219043 RepID=A0A0E9MPV8_9SPHN|nr:hypothetical protein [Sphingomonas changbaiensis]GAO39165.1 hypothetical protein SCH01S_28_00240 [Sphingomonas changbaiensis NBRC 104936]